MNTKPSGMDSQRGVALVLGLVLLLVLSLLAVSGMNSASLEFIMAGNDQYHQNAFQAAEAGIEQGIALGTFPTDMTVPAAVTGTLPTTTDTYSAAIAQLSPNPVGLPGSSGGSSTVIGAYFYQINSTGTAARGASIRNGQGIFILAPGSNGSYQ